MMKFDSNDFKDYFMCEDDRIVFKGIGTGMKIPAFPEKYWGARIVIDEKEAGVVSEGPIELSGYPMGLHIVQVLTENGTIFPFIDQIQQNVKSRVEDAVKGIDTKKAFDFLAQQIKQDSGYYYAWQSNIAMSFQDEMNWAGYQFPDLHDISNRAAKKFLDQIIMKSEQEQLEEHGA